MARAAIDASELKDLGRALRKVSREAANDLRRAERDAAKVVAAEAQALAAEYSGKAAHTVKPFTQGANVGVQVGSDAEPLGKLLEVGNADGRSVSTRTFKHPVYGRWVTGTPPQKMHPSVQPAILAKTDEFEDALRGGVQTALARAGLKMEG